MKELSCKAARQRLQAYHDNELPIGERIAVDTHVERCAECRAALAELDALREAFRFAAPGRATVAAFTQEEALGFHASVVSRLGAENRLALSTRVRDMFDDMHFIYAGMGAVASTVACVMIMVSMMRFANLASPGSNHNPIVVDAQMLMPRLDHDWYATTAATERKVNDEEAAFAEEATFAVSAVLTREGHVVNLELASEGGQVAAQDSSEARALQSMLGAMSQARFEPARVGGLPVAINMVWLVAHTTVRATPTPGAPAPSVKKRRVLDLSTPTAVRIRVT
jgi:hypothetical protein